MITISYSERFLHDARKLPKKQQEKLAQLIIYIQQDPFHPLLHTKPLHRELSGLYAFRITRDWRVIFQFMALLPLTIGKIFIEDDVII